MNISQQGIDFIKKKEGFRSKAYQDSGGKWTIGYGHTKNVKPGMTITEKAADKLLRSELPIYEKRVNDLVKIPLNQNQYDALASFDFNTGGLKYYDKKKKQYKNSQFLDSLNEGDIESAFKHHADWIHSNGKIEKGLINRRNFEKDLFFKPVPDTISQPEAGRLNYSPMENRIEPQENNYTSRMNKDDFQNNLLNQFLRRGGM